MAVPERVYFVFSGDHGPAACFAKAEDADAFATRMQRQTDNTVLYWVQGFDVRQPELPLMADAAEAERKTDEEAH